MKKKGLGSNLSRQLDGSGSQGNQWDQCKGEKKARTESWDTLAFISRVKRRKSHEENRNN